MAKKRNPWGGSHNSPIQKPEVLRRAVTALSRDIRSFNESLPKDQKIDVIVCCGISGAAVAFPVSLETGIPVWVVRKVKEMTHSPHDVDRHFFSSEDEMIKCPDVLRYIIIDDIVDTGATIRWIIEKMNGVKKYQNNQLLKLFLYSERSDDEYEGSFWLGNDGLEEVSVSIKRYWSGRWSYV
jgi:orotate phosphoribosyltransferase-like protein